MLNLIAAAVIYRFLYKDGWVTHHYDLRDPDSINLVPVIVEPIAVLCVLAYWVWRTPLLLSAPVRPGHDPGSVRGLPRRFLLMNNSRDESKLLSLGTLSIDFRSSN